MALEISRRLLKMPAFKSWYLPAFLGRLQFLKQLLGGSRQARGVDAICLKSLKNASPNIFAWRHALTLRHFLDKRGEAGRTARLQQLREAASFRIVVGHAISGELCSRAVPTAFLGKDSLEKIGP
jgi:hypothetical protein